MKAPNANFSDALKKVRAIYIDRSKNNMILWIKNFIINNIYVVSGFGFFGIIFMIEIYFIGNNLEFSDSDWIPFAVLGFPILISSIFAICGKKIIANIAINVTIKRITQAIMIIFYFIGLVIIGFLSIQFLFILIHVMHLLFQFGVNASSRYFRLSIAVIFSIIFIIIAIFVYYIRCQNRIIYGIVEFSFGILAVLWCARSFVALDSTFIPPLETEQDKAQLIFQFIASLYITVRGLSNIEDGLRVHAERFIQKPDTSHSLETFILANAYRWWRKIFFSEQ